MMKNEIIIRDLSYETMEIRELVIILRTANDIVEGLINQIENKTVKLESSIVNKLKDLEK